MSEETTITEEEAQQRIANAFFALDKIYQLHAPNREQEAWTCDHCNGASWPCETERVILESLDLT